MSYKILALDLDGTLTNDEKKITPFTKQMLFAAMDKGVKVVLASGRPDVGIRKLADELELYHRGGYILAFNGARIIDCQSGEIISETFLSEEYHESILQARELFPDIEVITYSDREILAENVTDYVKEEVRCLACPVKTGRIREILPERVIKFLVVGEHEKLEPVKAYFEEKFAGQFDCYYSQPFFLEVVPLNVDKANSLRWLIGHCGVKKEEFMACGDGFNDIPMLKEAGLPVVMENAYPEVKPYGKFVTADNNHDGVGLAVEKFILNEESLC